MKIELPESPPVEYYEGGKLTETAVEAFEAASATFRRSDGKGLFLEVSPDVSKRWRLAYRVDGRQNKISMGVWPHVSLVAARINTARAKALIRDGRDPSLVRRQRNEEEAAARAMERDRMENRFRAVADAWIRKSEPGWSLATAKQTRSRLQNDVLPYIGEVPVRDLTPPLILQTVQRIVDRGAIETARRVLRLIRQVCAFAVVTGRLDANPATDLAAALPTVKAKHMAALTAPAEVAGLLRAIHDYQGEAVVRAALRLAPLVFLRPGELRAACWREFDLDGCRWEIPADRMKMGEPLIVPLARQAVDILKDLRPLTGSGEFVFPSTRSRRRPISNNTLNAALRRMGFTKDEMTAHGFRAMARTMIEEQLGYRYELIEQQLGHMVRDPNGRAYNRTRHLEERTAMMQAWADYLDELKSGE
mgnify:CR=1 FL=1